MGLVNFVKGILIGVALVIPGLSGSIFALALGVYENILFAIKYFKDNYIKSILYLLPIVVGSGVGILISTKTVLWICEKFPVISYSVFIILIMASLPQILKKLSVYDFHIQNLLITGLAFCFILFLSQLTALDQQKSYVAISKITSLSQAFTLFFAGLFSCSIMSIPGVSGSVMLMVLGQYGSVYYAIASIADFIKNIFVGDFTNAAKAFEGITVIFPFAVGAVMGFIFITNILVYLLQKKEELVYYAVLGLITGGAYSIFINGVI